MPLLKRKPYVLKTPPRDLREDESVFQVRHTKEIFRDYEDYLKHMHLYRRRLWTCKVTGKQNLTYEEALVSERKASEKVQHFPKELMGPVLSMVQFSPLRIDELVDTIYKEFKDRFVLNEEVLGRSADAVCPCKILKIQQHASKDVSNYEVGWLDEHGKRFGTSTEPATNLMRKKHLFTRALLKSFIREAASSGLGRNAVWIVKSKLAQKHKLPVQAPAHVLLQESSPVDDSDEHDSVEVEVPGNGGHNTRKRQKREDDDSPQRRKVKKGTSANVELAAKETKIVKRTKDLKKGAATEENPTRNGKKNLKTVADMDAKATRPVKKIVKKVAVPPPKPPPPPPPPPIKYPIEDALVRPCPDDPIFTVRPLPSTDFILPMDCLGNLLMIWDFCTSFSKALQLSPFSLDEFEKSLDYRDGNAPLIAEVLFALLRTNLSDPALWEEFVKKRKRKSEVSVEVTLSTWKDDLSDLLLLTSVDKLGQYVPSIRQGYYKQFDTRVKLEILQALVERSLSSGVIRTQLDDNIEEHQAITALKREDEVEGFKRKKQEKLKQLPNGTTDVGVESNAKSRDIEVGEEEPFPTDDKDNGSLGIKSTEKDGSVGEEEQSVAWKTKGKRKLVGNHSPVSANGTSKKENQGDTATVSKSRQAYLRQKEALRQADEKEKKRLDGSNFVQEKGKGQVEAFAEQKAQLHRQDHLDRELEKRSIRTCPLGKDRDYNVYWFFNREGRLFVENKESTKWGYYCAKEEFEELIGSLNPKGVRERLLQKEMEKHRNKISTVLLRRSKDMAQKIALEEVCVRRSVRVRSAPRLPGFLTYVNKLRPT